jgi:hypothetical protein
MPVPQFAPAAPVSFSSRVERCSELMCVLTNSHWPIRIVNCSKRCTDHGGDEERDQSEEELGGSHFDEMNMQGPLIFGGGRLRLN